MLGKEDVCEAERGCLFKSDQLKKKPDQSLSAEQNKLDRVNPAKSMGEINSDMVKNKSTEEELRPQGFAAQKENISLECQTKDFVKLEVSEACVTENPVSSQKNENKARKGAVNAKRDIGFESLNKKGGGTKVIAKVKEKSLEKSPLTKGETSELRKADSVGGLQVPIQVDSPRKKSMDEWVDRLSVRKQKVSVVDRILEKKKKESLKPSLTVSADDLLDLEYHSVHAATQRSPLARQEAFERGSSKESQKLPMSPLLTAQEMRQRRFIDTRPKSFDSAHLLRLRRPVDDIGGFEKEATSLSTDEADYNADVQKLSRRKKSKSENLCEEHRFSDNELARRRQRKFGIRASASKTCP